MNSINNEFHHASHKLHMWSSLKELSPSTPSNPLQWSLCTEMDSQHWNTSSGLGNFEHSCTSTVLSIQIPEISWPRYRCWLAISACVHGSRALCCTDLTQYQQYGFEAKLLSQYKLRVTEETFWHMTIKLQAVWRALKGYIIADPNTESKCRSYKMPKYIQP